MKRNSKTRAKDGRGGSPQTLVDALPVVMASLSFLAMYAAVYFILYRYIPTERTFHMMSIPDYNRIIFIHVVSIAISAASAYIVYSGFLVSRSGAHAGKPREDIEMKRIYSILSDDEKAALKEIRRSRSISQDSLRFRMGWSKAKTSSIVTRLERYRLIQRERIGKTYRLIPEI